MTFVDINDMGDADVRDAAEMFVVILSPAPGRPRGVALVVASKPDNRDVDRLVRARLCTTASWQRQSQSSSRGRGPPKKVTTVHRLISLA